MTDRLTVPEAARLLELAEHVVKARIADGTFEVVGKGRWGAYLLDARAVREYGRRQQLGQMGQRMKLVLVVGDLLDERQALRVSGLTPEPASGILDALALHDVPGAPIIVASPEAVNAEVGVLGGLLGQIHLAVVSETQTAVPWLVEQYALIVDPTEPRRLVRWAWSALEQRTAAGALKL